MLQVYQVQTLEYDKPVSEYKGDIDTVCFDIIPTTLEQPTPCFERVTLPDQNRTILINKSVPKVKQVQPLECDKPVCKYVCDSDSVCFDMPHTTTTLEISQSTINCFDSDSRDCVNMCNNVSSVDQHNMTYVNSCLAECGLNAGKSRAFAHSKYKKPCTTHGCVSMCNNYHALAAVTKSSRHMENNEYKPIYALHNNYQICINVNYAMQYDDFINYYICCLCYNSIYIATHDCYNIMMPKLFCNIFHNDLDHYSSVAYCISNLNDSCCCAHNYTGPYYSRIDETTSYFEHRSKLNHPDSNDLQTIAVDLPCMPFFSKDFTSDSDDSGYLSETSFVFETNELPYDSLLFDTIPLSENDIFNRVILNSCDTYKYAHDVMKCNMPKTDYIPGNEFHNDYVHNCITISADIDPRADVHSVYSNDDVLVPKHVKLDISDMHMHGNDVDYDPTNYTFFEYDYIPCNGYHCYFDKYITHKEYTRSSTVQYLSSKPFITCIPPCLICTLKPIHYNYNNNMCLNKTISKLFGRSKDNIESVFTLKEELHITPTHTYKPVSIFKPNIEYCDPLVCLHVCIPKCGSCIDLGMFTQQFEICLQCISHTYIMPNASIYTLIESSHLLSKYHMTNRYCIQCIMYQNIGPFSDHFCLKPIGATSNLYYNNTTFATNAYVNNTQNNTVLNIDNGTQHVQNNQANSNNVGNDANNGIYEDSDSDNNSTPNGSFTNTDDVGPTNEAVLSCISINVGGFKSKECFPEFIANIVKKHDIISVSESKLSDTDTVEIDGYTSFYKNRSKFKRRSGGVLVLIKNCYLPHVKIYEEDCCKNKIDKSIIENYTFVNFALSKNALIFSLDDTILEKQTLFFSVYIEPENSQYFNRQVYDELQSVLSNLNFESVCLFGDFNSRSGNLNDLLPLNEHSDGLHLDIVESNLGIRVSKDKQTNNMGHELVSFCKACQLAICNGRAGRDTPGKLTCKNASVVDYVIMSYNLFDNIYDFEVCDFNELFSDVHCAVLIQLHKANKQASNSANEMSPNLTTNDNSNNYSVKWNPEVKDEFISNISNEDILALNVDLSTFLENPTALSRQLVTDITVRITSLLTTSATSQGMIKSKKTKLPHFKPNKQPWYNTECKNKHKLFSKARKQDIKHKSNNILFSNRRKEAAKEYKQTVRKYKRNYNLEFSSNLRRLKSNNPKAYWNILNKRDYKNPAKQPSCGDFLNMFKNMGSGIEEVPDVLSNVTYNGDPILNDLITRDEIHLAIKHLKNNKSNGVDLILNEFLKHTEIKLLDTFVKLFNIILLTGFIPENWAIGVIKPIYKNKGSSEDPNNYRGITILSCFAKLFTSVLNTRITKFLDENDSIGQEQAGFRNNFSTIDHLFTLYGLIDILLSRKKRLYVSFLDFEKAFDKVNWGLLWQKLLNENINGRILNVIKSIYATAKSCVMVDGACSEFYSMSIGIRQGENLSPILFALFLNDMKASLEDEDCTLTSLSNETSNLHLNDNMINTLSKLFLLLYADDTVIFSESAAGLQRILNKTKSYCDQWKLKLNAKKCKIIFFSRGKVRNYPQFSIGAENIEVVSSFLYLGLKLNYNNRMNVAQKDLYDRASRAMFGLLKKSRSLELPIDLTLDLFDQTVLPVLTYGCELWGFQSCDIVQKLQLRFYKMVLRLKQSTPSFMIFGDLGKYPVEITIKTRMLMFWFKLVKHLNTNKLSSTVYAFLLKLYNDGTNENKYLSTIKQTLVDIGLPHLWQTQDISNVNITWFKSHVKQSLIDNFLQGWYSKVDRDSVYTNFRMFKPHFKQEPFLSLLPNNCIVTLLRFRTTNNFLPVNGLRYQNIDRHERICTKCALNEVGDEFHFILVCPFFSAKRNEILPKYYNSRPNAIKFQSLMSSNHKQLLLKLKHFISFICNETR